MKRRPEETGIRFSITTRPECDRRGVRLRLATRPPRERGVRVPVITGAEPKAN